MLFRKMLRDMGRHKTQFISIFIMAFLGVFIYAGVGGEWQGLKKTVTDYYQATNFADVWLYGSSFSQKDEEAVRKLSGVTGTERCFVADSIGKFSNNPKITLRFVDGDKISKAYRISGEAFSSSGDGIWIDARFAKARHLAVGDSMAVTINGISISKKILGTVYSPEYVYLSGSDGTTPDFSTNGYAYLPVKSFPFPDKMTYNQILVTTNSKPDANLEKRINNALDNKISVYMTRENHTSDAMFQQEIDQHRSMGSIFPVAFLAIALLTMMTTMSRIVTSQRTQIGTLKALGFKKGKILWHYVSYGFWVSLAGSALGATVGPMTLPYLFYPSMSGFYTLPKWEPAIDISFYLMAGAAVFLCTLITWLACRNVLNDSPSMALRPKAPKNVHHGFLEKTALWKKIGFNAQWNLRDISRNRIRSAMAVVGVLGCTALLVCAFGMNDAMNDLKVWKYNDIDHFQSKLTVDAKATPKQIQKAIQSTNGQALMEESVEIKSGDLKKTGTLTVEDHVTLLKATDENRNYIALPKDGVSLSYKMAEMLGVKKGDKIRWHIFGDEKWTNSTIEQIYRDPSSQGICMSREYFEKLGNSFSATSILTSKKAAQKPSGISSVQQTIDLTKSWDDLTQAMMKMVYILIVAAAALAVVVLYNLGILSFTEMERELATLKVIGLKTKRLRRLLLTQNLWLSCIGFLLGIPAGKWLLVQITSTSGDSFDMITVIHFSNILLAFVITFVLAYLVNRMFSGSIRKLDLAGSLKSVE